MTIMTLHAVCSLHSHFYPLFFISFFLFFFAFFCNVLFCSFLSSLIFLSATFLFLYLFSFLHFLHHSAKVLAPHSTFISVYMCSHSHTHLRVFVLYFCTYTVFKYFSEKQTKTKSINIKNIENTHTWFKPAGWILSLNEGSTFLSDHQSVLVFSVRLGEMILTAANELRTTGLYSKLLSGVSPDKRFT